jgi:uncharacterized protein
MAPATSTGGNVLYAIHCYDRPDVLEVRLRVRAEHQDHLRNATVRIALCGPLLGSDGETMVGSLFVVEAPDREAAEAFANADPFRREGVWESVRINGFTDRSADFR